MTDSVSLIPGGAGNLGRAVTRAFLENGRRVAVPLYKTDRKDVFEELEAEYGSRLLTFALDLSTERGADSAVRQVIEWGARLDSVVHLVGGWSGGMRVHETPAELWERMIELNLRSAWLVARAALPVMLEAGGGSFVFVSSRPARERRAGQAAYAVAKSALRTLTEAIAEEYASDGIRANSVIPGNLDTADNRAAHPEADYSLWTPPEEVARVILFLASAEAAAVSGAALPVDGRS
ncbi:MAG: SDR family oxidoreductase [Gemmatimonadota bacterium]|nr:SDR family oxidoreductase [Gemmatimonadota bacterium]